MLFQDLATFSHHFDILCIAHVRRKGFVHLFYIAYVGTLGIYIAQRPAQMNANPISAVKGSQLRNFGNQSAAQTALITSELYASIWHFSQMSLATFADSSVSFPVSSSKGVSRMAFTACAVLTAFATVCFAEGEYSAKFFPSA